MTSLTCSCYAPLCHHPISLALGSRPLEQPLSGVLSDACAGLKSFFQSWPLPWPPHFFVAWACLMPVGRGSACGTAHQSVCLPCARSVRQWDPACPVSQRESFPRDEDLLEPGLLCGKHLGKCFPASLFKRSWRHFLV